MTKKLDSYRGELKERLKTTKVVYTDLDNTLLGPGGCFFRTAEKEFTMVPAQSLLALSRAGVDVTIVSGRSAAQLREIARLLGLVNFIAEIGCLISHGNEREEIFRNYRYPHPNDKTLYDAIAESGAPELLLATYAGRLEYHTPWSKGRECTHLFRGMVDLDEVNLMLAENGYGNLRLIDNGSVRTRGTLAALEKIHAYHLLPAEAGKASAILFDLKTRGLRADEVIALGDSISDISMAETAGHFFLVSDHVKPSDNLDQELKGRENVYLTNEKMGLGWAEVARLVIEK